MIVSEAPVALGFTAREEVDIIFLLKLFKPSYLLTARTASSKDPQAVEILEHNTDCIIWLRF